jgi:hypothetical protein
VTLDHLLGVCETRVLLLTGFQTRHEAIPFEHNRHDDDDSAESNTDTNKADIMYNVYDVY